MMHHDRRFNVTGATIEQVAQSLRARTYTLCTGFRLSMGAEPSAGDGHDYVILNDSFGEDGAQEYAVIRVLEHLGQDTYRGVMTDSLTVSWIGNDERLAELLRRATAPGAPAYGAPFLLTMQRDAPYPHCAHCA